MESIKHKMDTMVKEKEAATDKANSLEAEAQEYERPPPSSRRRSPKSSERSPRSKMTSISPSP